MRRLFVRLPNWVGDVVMAAPALAALRERLPEARIAWGCRPYVRRLLEAMPWKDEVLTEEGGRWSFIRTLRGNRFDAAVVMSSSFGSAFEAWAAGIPRRLGHAGHGRGFLLTDALPAYPEPVYMGRLYGELAAALTGTAPSGPMRLVPSSEDEAKAAALWGRLGLDEKRAVGLVPGASFGSAKCWPPEHFAALAKGLASRGSAVLLLFGPGEEALAGRIRAAAGEGLIPVGPDLVDLGVLPAVMRRLAVAVTNDTGPRHIAEALGVPVVVLLGPMDRRYTESGNALVKVLQEPVDCHPCNLRVCPIDHRCLVRLKPERVLDEVAKLLG